MRRIQWSNCFNAEDPMEQLIGAPLPSQEESTRAQRGRAVGVQNAKLRKIMKLRGPVREKALKKVQGRQPYHINL